MPKDEHTNNEASNGPPENSVVHWMYELNAIDDNGDSVYSDADLEEVIDTPPGDKSVTPAKRAAARWWLIMTARGTDDADALRSIERWNNRQFGTPRQSMTVDSTTVHVKRIILDSVRHDLPEEPPAKLVDLLTNAEIVKQL